MSCSPLRSASVCLFVAGLVGCSGSVTDSDNTTSAGASNVANTGGSVTATTKANDGGSTQKGGTTSIDDTKAEGTKAEGGSSNNGTSSGARATGGTSATGTTSTGGRTSQGGASDRGGSATGGTSATGATSTGGRTNQGGTSNRGGSATGGTSATGTTSTGGRTNQGGTSNRGGSATGGAATGGSANGGSSGEVNCAGSGWKLVWSDEFNGVKDTKVDSSTWVYDLGSQNGGWGNNELEYYTDSVTNVSMDGNGNLVITARKESQGGKEYTSARIKTQGKRSWQYGRIEGRLKIPKGQGIWPAFWMLGDDITSNTWPNCGEIDIMENVGSEPRIVHGSLHGPGYSGGSPLTGQTTLSEDVGNAFHLFAIEWDATSVRWYLDDKLYSTKTNKDVPAGATWVYTHKFFLILNVAVGGTWPGSPSSSTVFPQQMLVDYIRICQK